MKDRQRERERERKKKGRESVCVCVCVSERKRDRGFPMFHPPSLHLGPRMTTDLKVCEPNPQILYQRPTRRQHLSINIPTTNIRVRRMAV